MWYIVTISTKGFIKIEDGDDETIFEAQSQEKGIPFYEIKKPLFSFTTELHEDADGEFFGEVISDIIKKVNSQRQLLHFNTLLIKFAGSAEELMQIVKSEVGPNGIATIAAIENLLVSNYSQRENELLNRLLKN